MSARDPDPQRDPRTDGAAPGLAREPNTHPSDTDEPSLPGDERRSVAEWAVVLVLVALIVGVAWSQFGPLFETSTAGSGGSAPAPGQGLELEAEGVVLGGTAMSSLSDPGPRAVHDEAQEHDERDEPGGQADPSPQDDPSDSAGRDDRNEQE